MSDAIRQAVILAGGLGSRLGSRTAQTPKPLLPVGDRPFLDWVLANLASQGIREVILTVGYLPESFEEWLASESHEVDVRTFIERERLGTGGALPSLLPDLDPTFLVINGDTLFDAPIQALADLRASNGALGAIALRRVADVGRYGGVRLEGATIIEFAEKEREGPGLINGGVYVFAREAIDYAPGACSLETDVLPLMVAGGGLVGLPCDGFFIDIGVPASLDEAQTSVPAWWAEARG